MKVSIHMIVERWLRDNNYDGLRDQQTDCSCFLNADDDRYLFNCMESDCQCCAGHIDYNRNGKDIITIDEEVEI